MRKKHLSISEKRDWLASLFRDTTGEISQAEKFKAMVEDTRLAMLSEEKAASKSSKAGKSDESQIQLIELLSHLPSGGAGA